MSTERNFALQSLKVLALASDGYFETADELATAFIRPQVEGAKAILARAIDIAYPEIEPEVQAAKDEDSANE